jgi:hypothetical protein
VARPQRAALAHLKPVNTAASVAGDGAGTVITGAFTTTGQAQGHMHVVDALAYQGAQYTCTYDDDSSAKLQQ